MGGKIKRAMQQTLPLLGLQDALEKVALPVDKTAYGAGYAQQQQQQQQKYSKPQQPVTTQQPQRPAGYYGQNTAAGDRQAYQHDAYYDWRTSRGPYAHPTINKFVEMGSKLAPMFGLPGFEFFPSYPILPNMRERYDPETFRMDLASSLDRLIPNRDNTDEAGEMVRQRWGNYLGIPVGRQGGGFQGTNISGGWTNDPLRGLGSMYSGLV